MEEVDAQQILEDSQEFIAEGRELLDDPTTGVITIEQLIKQGMPLAVKLNNISRDKGNAAASKADDLTEALYGNAKPAFVNHLERQAESMRAEFQAYHEVAVSFTKLLEDSRKRLYNYSDAEVRELREAIGGSFEEVDSSVAEVAEKGEEVSMPIPLAPQEPWWRKFF